MRRKLRKFIILLYLSIAMCACNNDNSKKKDRVAEVGKQAVEKPISKEPEYYEQEPDAIESLVTTILKTSPRYLQLTKGLQKRLVENGGLYFDVYLEKSPERSEGMKGIYSETYDFTLFEMYEERQLNTSRFSFNPERKQLFEYDIATDSFVAIAFDTTLLFTYDSLKNSNK